MTHTFARLSPRQRTLALAIAGALALGGIGALAALGARAQDGKEATKKGAARPALSVSLVAPETTDWAATLPANGNIVAWQEAVIGAEISGYRLTEVLVNVGDNVRKGQLLARISADTVAAELAQARAAMVEAEAMLAEARANADRARQIQTSGALSAQQINQFLTAEQTAAARVSAAQARVQADEVRVAQTRVVAPDDGVISARAATVGSLTQPGQELFRLIRGSRLEWRAEVNAAELPRLKSGLPASIQLPGATGARVAGKVRMVGPTVDPQTRNALVYVDLPSGTAARAGMFARGEIEFGRSGALTLPQTAVLLRDGFSYVYTVDKDGRATQVKVDVGRRVGERIEITGGLTPQTRVVATGGGFLADGDLVRVVEPAAKTAQK
jgi:HlyD family secretion protein